MDRGPIDCLMLHAATIKEARKSLEAGQEIREDAAEAVKTTLGDVSSSLTSEAHTNLKADTAMREDRKREQEVRPSHCRPISVLADKFAGWLCCSRTTGEVNDCLLAGAQWRCQ